MTNCVIQLDLIRTDQSNDTMLYKFKSAATGDLIMLQANGLAVLQIIGKDDGAATGIVLPEQMAAAIAALKAAMARQEAEQQAAVALAKAQGDTPPSFEAVSLRKRAWPFLEMLERCLKANTPITWGV